MLFSSNSHQKGSISNDLEQIHLRIQKLAHFLPSAGFELINLKTYKSSFTPLKTKESVKLIELVLALIFGLPVGGNN